MFFIQFIYVKELLYSSIIHSSDIYPAVGTELQIGLWGNDPIYRQVFTGQLASSSGNMQAHQLPTYIKLIDLRFIIRREYSKSQWEGLSPMFSGEDTSQMTTAFIESDHIIIKNLVPNYFDRYYTIVIDYCKNYGGTSINP